MEGETSRNKQMVRALKIFNNWLLTALNCGYVCYNGIEHDMVGNSADVGSFEEDLIFRVASTTFRSFECWTWIDELSIPLCVTPCCYFCWQRETSRQVAPWSGWSVAQQWAAGTGSCRSGKLWWGKITTRLYLSKPAETASPPPSLWGRSEEPGQRRARRRQRRQTSPHRPRSSGWSEEGRKTVNN